MLALALAVSVLLHEAPDEPGEVDARAKRLSAEAKNLFAERRYAEAIERFRESQTIRATSANVYNIGKCFERLGQTESALRSYREYLRIEPTAKEDPALRKDLAAARQRLDAKGMHQLAVLLDPPTAQARVDGQVLEGSPAYVELRHGAHTLEVSLDGFEPVTKTLVVTRGQFSETHVTLRPIVASQVIATQSAALPSESPEPPSAPVVVSEQPPRVPAQVPDVAASPAPGPAVAAGPLVPLRLTPARRSWAYATAGLAAACAVVGVIFGVRTLEFGKDASTALSNDAHQRLLSMAVSSALWADIMYGAALVGAGAATWLFISSLNKEPPRAGLTLGIEFGSERSGIAVSGWF